MMMAEDTQSKPGRTPLCTAEFTARFCDLIRAGNYCKTVCNFLGITEQAVWNWLQWGAEGKDAHGPDPDGYRRFFESYTQAEAQAEITSVAQLKQAGQAHRLPDHLVDEEGKPLPGVQSGDWRATAEFLARRYRERWAPNARTEVTGAGGGALEHRVVFEVVRPESNDDGDGPADD